MMIKKKKNDLGISEIRYLFFRGPIWMRLQNSGSFCIGQVPGTSHVATRPKKKTGERRICPSLSRPFAAGPASSLFVVVQSVLDVIHIPGTTVVASPVFFPYFFFFVGWFLKKKRCSRKKYCLLLLAVFLLLNFRSFSRFFAKVYAPGPHGDCTYILHQRSSLPGIT